MQEECIVCKAPLIYLEQDEWMECELCHKKELSKTRCQNGHYVCNDCHTKGLDTILSLCIDETSRKPIEIVRKMMDAPFCHMHGPEHHVMVGAALLTAYKNAEVLLICGESVMEMAEPMGKPFQEEPADSGVPAERESAQVCLYLSCLERRH